MATPNVFISHRWAYPDDYDSLVSKFKQYGLGYLNYSVPKENPLDVNRTNQIKIALREQVRQCNYFIIFANMSMVYSPWCKYEIEVAKEYRKPILTIQPRNYNGNTPLFMQNADTESGPVGFNTPAIIRKICIRLNHQVPAGI
jgi:hypothetical protein